MIVDVRRRLPGVTLNVEAELRGTDSERNRIRVNATDSSPPRVTFKPRTTNNKQVIL